MAKTGAGDALTQHGLQQGYTGLGCHYPAQVTAELHRARLKLLSTDYSRAAQG